MFMYINMSSLRHWQPWIWNFLRTRNLAWRRPLNEFIHSRRISNILDADSRSYNPSTYCTPSYTIKAFRADSVYNNVIDLLKLRTQNALRMIMDLLVESEVDNHLQRLIGPGGACQENRSRIEFEWRLDINKMETSTKGRRIHQYILCIETIKTLINLKH